MYFQPDTLTVIICMGLIFAFWIGGLIALRIFAPDWLFKALGGE